MIREEPRKKGYGDEDGEPGNVRTYFDHEKLDVYQLELQFITWVTALHANIKQRRSDARIAEVVDQLGFEASLLDCQPELGGRQPVKIKNTARVSGVNLRLRCFQIRQTALRTWDNSSLLVSHSALDGCAVLRVRNGRGEEETNNQSKRQQCAYSSTHWTPPCPSNFDCTPEVLTKTLQKRFSNILRRLL